MNNKLAKFPIYNKEVDGNPFEWIVTQAEATRQVRRIRQSTSVRPKRSRGRRRTQQLRQTLDGE